MNYPITMPALSDTMSDGRLVRWVKKIGDPVKKGESLADVETDKAVMEVEAFHDGYLAGPLAAEGGEMRVGTTIGYINDTPGAALTSAAEPRSSPDAVVQQQTGPLSGGASIAPIPPPGRPAAPAAQRVRASPYARRLAQQRGMDAEQTPEIMPRPAVPDHNAGPPYRVERLSTVREAVARNMISSLAIPTFRMTARLALAPLIAVSKEFQLSLTLLLARACALTVKAHPLFNAMYRPEGLALRDRVDVAIAVDTPDGLLAPVIRDAAARPVAETRRRLA